MELGLFFLVMFFGLQTARVGTIADRDGIESSNVLIIMITFTSMISTFSVIIWGFLNLEWWITIGTFIIFSLALGLLVSRERLGWLFYIMPVTGIITIGSTAYLWFF